VFLSLVFFDNERDGCGEGEEKEDNAKRRKDGGHEQANTKQGEEHEEGD